MRFNLRFITVVAVALSLVSCENLARRVVSKAGKNVAKEAVEKAGKETAEAASRKVAKEVSGEAAEKALKGAIGKSMREMATSNTAIRSLYDNFSSRISKEFADGIVVNATEKGVEMASRDFPNSAIRMKNSGPMNEFLNHLLPQKKYIVDECFVYDTDALGRVAEGVADRTKAFKSIQRNTQRNTDIQKYIVESLDGRKGLDDGGHLFANNTGGPNELINQIPMSRELNQHGKWREMERMEEKALREGKQVTSKRKLLYRGSEKRPYAIEFTSIIDGKETSVLIENI